MIKEAGPPGDVFKGFIIRICPDAVVGAGDTVYGGLWLLCLLVAPEVSRQPVRKERWTLGGEAGHLENCWEPPG